MSVFLLFFELNYVIEVLIRPSEKKKPVSFQLPFPFQKNIINCTDRDHLGGLGRHLLSYHQSTRHKIKDSALKDFVYILRYRIANIYNN